MFGKGISKRDFWLALNFEVTLTVDNSKAQKLQLLSIRCFEVYKI